jgi:hypothetical protein
MGVDPVRNLFRLYAPVGGGAPRLRLLLRRDRSLLERNLQVDPLQIPGSCSSKAETLFT